MKRLFTLFCAAGLLLALAACGRQAEEPASTLKPHVFFGGNRNHNRSIDGNKRGFLSLRLRRG